MADSKRRASSRSNKRTSDIGEKQEDTSSKKLRRCEKVGCSDIEPSCCLLTEGCTGSGYTSRWYHMSLGEHFCNNCFDNLYRPGRPCNLLYNDWINEWSSVARVTKPTIKQYVANMLLPYWVRCTNVECHKWRMVCETGVLETDFIKTFKCSMATDLKSCRLPEDKLVAFASNEYFVDQLTEAPLLKNSPAAPFLKRFLCEDIGLCPLNCKDMFPDHIEDVEPFLVGQCGEASIWPKPDATDDDEKLFVSNTLISSATYLGLRNLIVAVWNFSHTEWLDINKVNPYIICRGLIRIHLWSLSCLVLKLLNRKSVINFGILENPHLTIRNSSEADVLVIGGGISGLAAAKHLQNLGLNVTIFEANSDIGGRIKDNPLFSKACIIQGILNNPFKVLASQAKLTYQKLEGETLIFDSKGKSISSKLEKNMQYKLRGIAQGALDTALQSKMDCNWYDTITNNFNKFVQMTSTESNYQLFYHLLQLFQMEIGADFRNLSLLNWESSTCVKGSNVFFPDGIKSLLKKLATKLNVVHNVVKEIDYSGEKVKVVTFNGEHTFSKVLVTVPLPIMRDANLTFKPSLPDFKQKAMLSLGDYYCSKLIMQFSKKFWISSHKSQSIKEFSVISDESLFPLFLDVTVSKKNSLPTLVAFIPPQTLGKLGNKSEKDILQMCLTILRNTFGKDKVLSPSNWHMTDCGKTKYNSYASYIKVGSGESVFDEMAASVDDKIFFAGEATFRNIPGNVAGAYLSGLREAAKISDHFELP